MEVALINAIMHSPTFPPHDPWLSGYAISYYYFGYVMTAMLAELTSAPAAIAHNLMLSLVFALSAISAYGLVYDLLLAYWQAKGEDPPNRGRASALALLGPFFLLIISNLEGVLEAFHQRGIGWATGGGGTATSAFWAWLNMKGLSVPPTPPVSWVPSEFFWWWRASRTLQDYSLQGAHLELIDEFPFFSYLLGDLHPHVLAMPFDLLALALALHVYLGGWEGKTVLFRWKVPLNRGGLLLSAVVLGSLTFLNTWDFPVYWAIVSGALLLRLVRESGWSWHLVGDVLKLSVPLVVLISLLYTPFYLSFSSQANGIVPNVIYPTRGAYLWIMFGCLLVPLFAFLVHLRPNATAGWRMGSLVAGLLTVLLGGASIVFGTLAQEASTGQPWTLAQALAIVAELFRQSLARRLSFIGGWLTIALLISATIAYLSAKANPPDLSAAKQPAPFLWMLTLAASLLVLVPDFLYLRDQFGWRINTIFKFYYQAWVLWSLVAAFAAAVMVCELRNTRRAFFVAGMVLLIGLGLVYPFLSLPGKISEFGSTDPKQWTLDGEAYLASTMPDDYKAFPFMEHLEPGVVVEAMGGDYSDYARVSTFTGLPAVLGWKNHEEQWRGGDAEIGSREADIQTLYTTSAWDKAEAILKRYNIRYVYVGPLERTTYRVDSQKFADHLMEIYHQNQVVIYQVP